MTQTATLPPEVTSLNPAPARMQGGAFLITDATPAQCFFPEDFTLEQKQIAQATADFATEQVMPETDAIEAKDFSITRRLIAQAAELGLTAADIPEEYGGLGLDKATSAIIAENISKQASFSVAFSAHTGIGTLPLVWYGTPAQKAKYLPKLADGSFVGAYALSESSSGSDALSARTRAVWSDDGQTYTLNGEKMWITNGGFADVYTVFAKCLIPTADAAGKPNKDAGKERLTAFLIERGTPGFSNGPEEHKLGIRGSSTTPLILTDCVIPAANLLGEVGKGHHIAFNILNVGRYKLGNAAVGGAKMSFANSVKYAKERKAFGKSISEFGLIQQKLADMATGIFIGEAVCYRTVGMIDQALAEIDRNDTRAIQAQIESYAVECSIVKVWTSEMLDMVVDEGLQIFAGYGYVEEFPAERAYRDSRINRIFEGTNEINRLIITGWLLKSATSGKLALMPAIRRWPAGLGVRPSGFREEADPVRRRRRFAALRAGPGGRAGGNGRAGRHDSERVRHGIGNPARGQDDAMQDGGPRRQGSDSVSHGSALRRAGDRDGRALCPSGDCGILGRRYGAGAIRHSEAFGQTRPGRFRCPAPPDCRACCRSRQIRSLTGESLTRQHVVQTGWTSSATSAANRRL
jgi:alkylation response protein AidB-like acyl-CoA dehydrogenase